jgi:hypothetical protein
MLRSNSHHDHHSRAVGLVAFLFGIAMLAAVFVLAYHLFTQPVPHLGLTNPPHGVPPPAASIGLSLAAFFERLLLALLTIVGSVVAGRGVHLCFAAHGPHAASGTEVSAPPNTPVALTVATMDKNPSEKSA